MFSESELAEICKGWLPYYFLFVLPIFILISPDPAAAAYEFQGYRLQQYELKGIYHGSKLTQINLEARSLSNWSTQRHCVITRLCDLTISSLNQIKRNAGALIIVLPKKITSLDNETTQKILDIEEDLQSESVELPIYFASWTPELEEVLLDVEHSKLTDEKAATAFEAIANLVHASGYQVVVSAFKPAARHDAVVTSIQGKLLGHGVEQMLPSVGIIAHYDSDGAATELSFGADSNASGVVMLLELVRIFSHLFSSTKAQPKANLMFTLSGAGKLNYYGSKRWLDDHIDTFESTPMQDSSFILCLDALGQTNDMYIHVSKPPKNNTPAFHFTEDLKRTPNHQVSLVHKKINLAGHSLDWEHERFCIRRLSAFTLSSLKSHKDKRRRTILDVNESIDHKVLVKKIETVASSLARHVFNLSYDSDPLASYLSVSQDAVKGWLDFLTSIPRSATLVSDKNNPLVKALVENMKRYIKDTKVFEFTADKKDPEFVFYEVAKINVNIYSVKPAVFDLLLTLSIGLYLIATYGVIKNFNLIYSIHQPFNLSKKVS